MKKAMNFNLFSLVVLSFISVSAFAGQRVIVIIKNQQSFQSANMTFRSKGSFSLKRSGENTKLAHVDGQVEASLEHLNTLIVNAKDEAEIAKLQQDPNVAYVEKEIFHQAPRPVAGWVSRPAKNNSIILASVPDQMGNQTQFPGIETPWGVLAVKAPQAWALANQGEGARVLVLDTGMDVNHPSLKANFEQGRDFTDVNTSSNVTDGVGHGTHVSGTIAGVMDSQGFSGVAPKAKILMGRVCADRGCSNVAVAAGINWGIKEHVDVISMSLGGGMSTPAERDAIAKADSAGLTVIAASGNDGSNHVSFPAALPTVISVGAVDDKSVRASFSQYGPELTIMAPGVNIHSSVPLGTGREASVNVTIGNETSTVNSATFQGAREVLNGESNELVDIGFGTEEEISGKNIKNKFVLVGRGQISFAVKIKNAIAAGATGVVVYNNVPGLVQGALTSDGSTLPIAVFMVEKETGEKIAQSLKAGVAVRATLKTVATDYASFQGTSMATPHVAGVAALIKAANKDLTGSQVKDILVKTAVKLGPNTSNEYGAGLVDAEAAVAAAVQMKH